ncbi:MAG: SPOR domain-containing protein [Pseudomonadaceae bacterium]|nr:SPOR domain-containing protein [Pseudomonadaceae bacterium]
MNERTRYRVTGSIFLIALAVICLPMIFDGAGTAVSPPPPTPVVTVPRDTPAAQALAEFDDVVPVSDVVERVDALREEVDEAGFDTASDTRFGEPVLAQATEETRVWAIQAASFASKDNALAFQQRLRDAGYEAFTSTLRSARSGEELVRVAVGPLLNADEAKSIQTQIENRFNVEAVLVEMSP